jgi:hypothetical protein
MSGIATRPPSWLELESALPRDAGEGTASVETVMLGVPLLFAGPRAVGAPPAGRPATILKPGLATRREASLLRIAWRLANTVFTTVGVFSAAPLNPA